MEPSSSEHRMGATTCTSTTMQRSTSYRWTESHTSTAVKEVNQLMRGQVKCPIHEGNVLRGHCNKKSGRTFYGCTVETCPVFCSDDKLRDYCDVVEKKLLPIYKIFTPSCQCGRPSALQMSTSERNPRRPYFSCKSSKRCNFFQWGDAALSDQNFEVEEKRRMQKVAKEGVLFTLTSHAVLRHFRW